jgi:hypothetical protein
MSFWKCKGKMIIMRIVVNDQELEKSWGTKQQSFDYVGFISNSLNRHGSGVSI